MSEFDAYNNDTSSGENSPNLEDLSKTPKDYKNYTSDNSLDLKMTPLEQFLPAPNVSSPTLSESSNKILKSKNRLNSGIKTVVPQIIKIISGAKKNGKIVKSKSFKIGGEFSI